MMVPQKHNSIVNTSMPPYTQKFTCSARWGCARIDEGRLWKNGGRIPRSSPLRKERHSLSRSARVRFMRDHDRNCALQRCNPANVGTTRHNSLLDTSVHDALLTKAVTAAPHARQNVLAEQLAAVGDFRIPVRTPGTSQRKCSHHAWPWGVALLVTDTPHVRARWCPPGPTNPRAHVTRAMGTPVHRPRFLAVHRCVIRQRCFAFKAPSRVLLSLTR